MSGGPFLLFFSPLRIFRSVLGSLWARRIFLVVFNLLSGVAVCKKIKIIIKSSDVYHKHTPCETLWHLITFLSIDKGGAAFQWCFRCTQFVFRAV